MDKKTVTSALPYIHGVPHLGNMAGSVLSADILHRYFDIRGEENIFICGGDVHGTPLELEALERGEDPRDIKDEQTEKVRKAYESLDMDFSVFSDTHSEYNRRQTHDMFEELYCNGLIREEVQNMPYSEEDGRFLPDRYIEGECPECEGLARGDQCDECGTLLDPDELIDPQSTISESTDIEFRDTKHLFLDLRAFKDELKDWIKEESPVPKSMEKQVLHDLEEAEHRSITRDQDWGFEIPVERVNKKIEDEGLEVDRLDPEIYDDKVLYVWFDAPIGYIGFTRELFDDSEEWKQHWSADADIYYSIGKDNAIFHTIIWPTMLLGSRNEEIEYGLPKYEFIQQYMMWENQPFSKSRGIGITIDEAVDHYPSDYWRFYITKVLPTTQDTNFSWDDFESEINNVLNDTIGNFVNRTLSLAEQWFDNEVPTADLTAADKMVEEEALEVVDEYIEAFEDHDLKTGLKKAVRIARIGDQYLSEEEPWNNEERREETLHVALHLIRALGVMLYPYTPEASGKIEKMLNVDIHTEEGMDEFIEPLLGNLNSGHKLGEREVLFEKIDVSSQKDSQETESEPKEETSVEMEGLVSFDDFQDMDLRIGKIESVEDHPNADRLYLVKVDVGDQVLQTCAGLKNHYRKNELEDRQVVVLANLEPAELRGEKSECMMLAAEDSNENVELIGLENELEVGSQVR